MAREGRRMGLTIIRARALRSWATGWVVKHNGCVDTMGDLRHCRAWCAKFYPSTTPVVIGCRRKA